MSLALGCGTLLLIFIKQGSVQYLKWHHMYTVQCRMSRMLYLFWLWSQFGDFQLWCCMFNAHSWWHSRMPRCLDDVCSQVATTELIWVPRLITLPSLLDLFMLLFVPTRTPLHIACARGHEDVITELLQWKAKTNVGDNAACTPLMKVCGNQFIDVQNAAISAKKKKISKLNRKIIIAYIFDVLF